MSDRTNGQIVFYSCPPEQAGVALAVIQEHLQRNDWGTWTAPPGVLQLGETFGAWEVNCGATDEIASSLMTQAPACAFLTHEDPYGEWLGSVSAYTPELGLFTASCDADGTPQFTPAEVRKILDMDSVEEQERALGHPWLEGGLLTLLPPEGQRLLPSLDRWDCPQCGDDGYGRDPSCTNCVEVLDERQAKAQHRVIIDYLPDTDLVKVVARPAALVFRCRTCYINGDLNGRKVEVRTPGYLPTKAQTHTAHQGFAIGFGSHEPADMEIVEVLT